MLHKLNLSTGAFNFAANPVILNASAPTSFNISATGYGRAIGNSGTRIWDTNITPAISTQLVSNSAPFTFPSSNR